MPFSLGELVIRRKLEKDDIGKEYHPGQEHVTMVGKETCILSWVDESGAACMVFADYRDEGWYCHPQAVRAGFDFVDLRPIPRAFAMSDKWLRLIQSTKKERRPSSGSRKKDDAPDEAEESSSPA